MEADILSWVTTWLDLETVKSILDGVTLGTMCWAEIHDPAMVEGNQHLEQEVWVAARCPLVEMHITNSAKAQWEDPMLSTVLDWMKAQKQTNVRMLLAEHASSKEDKLILQNWQNFTIHQGALYLCSMPKGKTEDLLLFAVPEAHCVTALNSHPDAGHQGHDSTLSLLQECFWWLGITNQVQKSLRSCMHCLQHKGNLSKVPLHPIVSTASMDLLHIGFTSIEMTMELNRLPKVVNVLVFRDHFMKHVMAYVPPNQTEKTVANFYTRVTSQSLGLWPGS